MELRELLRWVKQRFGDVEIYITENGYADHAGNDDKSRAVYLQVFKKANAVLNKRS